MPSSLEAVTRVFPSISASQNALEYGLRADTLAHAIGATSVAGAFLSLKAIAAPMSPASVTYATKSPSTGAPYFDTET